MNRTRLQILADYLQRVPPERFTTRHWAKGKPFCRVPNEPAHSPCETVACAMGWATTIPAFKRAGLRLGNWDEEGVASLSYQHGTGMNAASSFMGISIEVALWLFGYDAYHEPPTPKQVAQRITTYIRRRVIP